MLKTLDITNFTCFPEAKLAFSSGLNVIVGENGTGKSHLLKLGYAVLRTLARSGDKKVFLNKELAESLGGIFKARSENLLIRSLKSIIPDLAFQNDISGLIRKTQQKDPSAATVFAEAIDAQNNIIQFSHILCDKNQKNKKIDSTCNIPVFIPPKEILSIFRGFEATNRNRELDFDETYVDLAFFLSLPSLKGKKYASVHKDVLSIERIIGKNIKFSYDGSFVFTPFSDELEQKTATYNASLGIHVEDIVEGLNSTPQEITANMSAEGHNKIGMLAWLIKNGSLGRGSSLFWDEPEANLNPKLLKALASVLIDLSSIMQITIATHSLFLVRELEIAQEKKQLKNARYFGLHFNEDGNGVNVTQGDSPNHIGDIVALDEEIAQSSRYLSANAENLDDSM